MLVGGLGDTPAGRSLTSSSLGCCFLLLFLLVCGCFPPCTTSFCLQPTNPSSPAHHRAYQVSTSSEAGAAAAPSKNNHFESLTVKELRLLVKEQNPSQRGVLSTLKRKKDLVHYLSSGDLHRGGGGEDVAAANGAGREDFLPGAKDEGSIGVVAVVNDEEAEIPETNENDLVDFSSSADLASEEAEDAANDLVELANDAAEDDDEVATQTNIATSPPRPTRAMPLNMAPRQPQLSLKDALLKKVREMYPDAVTEKMSDDNPVVDIRQTHHPIMAGRPLTDLDVVFLGTASCMPGITRGVSCTAIKLNWRRSAASTWLFDVGECTQVKRNIIQCIVVAAGHVDCNPPRHFSFSCCAKDDYFFSLAGTSRNKS
jgi:hypothetical protein